MAQYDTEQHLRTLDQLGRGERARIVSIDGNTPLNLRRRLLDMGLTKGAEIRVDRHAPLGDPMQLYVKGYRLAVRLSEAREILVEPLHVPDAATSPK